MCRTAGFGAVFEYSEDEAGPVGGGAREVRPFMRRAGEIVGVVSGRKVLLTAPFVTWVANKDAVELELRTYLNL